MTKGSEAIWLFFIIAIGLVLILFFFLVLPKIADVGCRQSQMDDLSRVLRELDNFERMNTTLQPGSYNILPEPFTVRTSCTSEIMYVKEINYVNKVRYEGVLKVIWTDGITEKIPTNDTWKMEDGTDMSLTKDSWDMKVSLKSVVAISRGTSA